MDTGPRPARQPGVRAGVVTQNQHARAARKFLRGPQPRAFELRRAVSIFRELVYGFRKLHFVGPCVTVFGSARFPESHPYYAARAAKSGPAWRRTGSPS